MDAQYPIIDYANWKLQLPIATTKSTLEIYPTELANYQSEYFYFSNNSLVFRCKSNGATTPNSNNPRTELRELPLEGWHLTGTHILRVECAVMELPVTQKGMIIGQIHGIDNDKNPQLLKLYFATNGKLTARIKNDVNPDLKQDTNLPLGQYELGERIRYEIIMNEMTLTVNVTTTTTNSKSFTFKNNYWRDQSYYFKAGNYFQINERNPLSESTMNIYSITTQHY